MKQDHFTEDSKHKKRKWLVSTCPKVRIKCSHFGVSQTEFCHIYLVWVIISFCFCPCANLLYFMYSAPSNMAAPVSWGASGRVKWHSLTPSSVLHSLVARFPHPLQAVSLDRKTSVPKLFCHLSPMNYFFVPISRHIFILSTPILPYKEEKKPTAIYFFLFLPCTCLNSFSTHTTERSILIFV